MHRFSLLTKSSAKFLDRRLAGLRTQKLTRVLEADKNAELNEIIAADDESDSNLFDIPAPKLPSQVFNTTLYERARKKKLERFLERFRRNEENPTEVEPSLIAQLFLNDLKPKKHIITTERIEEDTKKNEPKKISYPYAIHTNLNSTLTMTSETFEALKERLKNLSSVHSTESDYHNDEDYDLEVLKSSKYGTSDPSIAASTIPCGGCGALLHCQDTGLPGFIPREIFKGATNKDLRSLICQRCHFLKDYNIALGVNIPPEQYSKLLSEIKSKVALVILVVDLLDFPISIWPGLVNIIGKNRPICVVGNKVDLMPKDRHGYVERIKASLIQSLKDVGVDTGRNVKHVCLVSAKTGYGIEDLISKLQSQWGMKGDVYLVGCTNVGKSSLFNALIQSDFCKSQAVDIIQRATISPWPGTTLNLLKFPILSPTGKRLAERTKRLNEQQQQEKEERRVRELQLQQTKNWKYATLMSRVGFTFYSRDVFRNKSDGFSMILSLNPNPDDISKAFNPKNQEFADSKWCFDTPGTVQPDQILNLLTLEELKLTLPKEIIEPRTYAIKPNYTFFLGGLGRIDVKAVEGDNTIRFTVFSSQNLPVSVVPTHLADEFYKRHLGTDVLGVPLGDESRLKDFPALIGKEITLHGVGWRESCADIILSSAGWVSVTCGNSESSFVAYTPAGKGCVLRKPAILPFAVELRGKRIKYTPCFRNDFIPLS